MQTIENGFSALYAYADSKENNPSQTDQMRDKFKQACGGQACESALNQLVSSIKGGDLTNTFGCDLAELIYRGTPSMQGGPFYRGHRDIGLMMYAGVWNYAMVGLMIQSAYVTIANSNISAW
jgi:hypothetical protein